MRKNHHGKKDRLVKRVFALCLALAVICTCLVPVFATEGLIDPQVNQEASRPVDDGEASYPDDEFAGFGEEEATRPVDGGEVAGFGGDEAAYPDDEAAGFGEDEVATRPVEGGEDNLDGGPNVKETEWGTVIEYDTSTSTDTSSSTGTQWSGEDDVVEKPDDKVVVSGDEIKKLQDMVVYRFWLKELNANDLQDITAQAQINNMTESEYLARNGEVLWNLYFIQAVPRAETIADYSSYIENPSSNRDPKGELRLFDYWYTLDEFGNRVRLNLTDPTSNILDDKTTTVNVYAAWKDGTVGSDEEEDVDHEDLVDKNPVPVDLTAKASASYEDEEGNLKTTTLPVEVKNLPSAADHLSVIHMGDDDMERFYESHSNDFGSMAPILGLKISPKNAKGETVQPAKGEKATVTVSGLDKLPEIAAMEEEGALTADALKVLHQTADGSVETLDVLTYTNGSLTFETSSFSPFVIALTGGYAISTLKDGTTTITVALDHAQVIGVHYDSSLSDKQAGALEFNTINNTRGNKGTAVAFTNGTSFSMTWNHYKTNYWVFFVKPDDGYMVTGIGATGTDSTNRNDIYSVDGSYANISGYPGIATLVSRAKQMGYKGLFGYSVGWQESIYKNAKIGFSVTGEKPPITVEAVSDKRKDVKPNDELTFTVTVTPGKAGKDANTSSGYTATATATNAILDEITINGVNCSVRSWYKNDDGTWTAIVKYTVTEDDCRNEEVTLYVKASVDYEVKLTAKENVTTTTTITSDDTVKCAIAEKLPVKYIVTYENDPGNHPAEIDQIPEDNQTRYEATSVEVLGEWSNGSKVIDSVNGGEWTFNGWRVNSADAASVVNGGDTVAMTAGGLNFYGKWTFKKTVCNITVSKHVTGLMGDTQKEFTFKVTGEDLKANTKILGADGTELNHGSPKFVMKHGDTATVTNVPYNAVFCVYEDKEGATAYETSATGQTITQSGENNRKFYYKVILVNGNPMLQPCKEDGTAIGNPLDTLEIVVTNHCTLKPDTGVLLDTLPYIVILAVVVGGGILLMLRKRRKNDD